MIKEILSFLTRVIRAVRGVVRVVHNDNVKSQFWRLQLETLISSWPVLQIEMQSARKGASIASEGIACRIDAVAS